MAISTPNMRISYRRFTFLTIGFYFDLFLHPEEPALHSGSKDHIRARIGALNFWNRANFADVLGPVMRRGDIADQAAFFTVLPAEIITEEITAFKSGWSSHSGWINPLTIIKRASGNFLE
jgi:hypothetical protein